MFQTRVFGFVMVSLLLLGGCQNPFRSTVNTNSNPVPLGQEEIEDENVNIKDQPEVPPDDFAEVNTDSSGTTENTVNENTNTSINTNAPIPASELESKKQPSIKTFDLIATQFEFSPNSLVVNEGDTVIVKMTSVDVAHGFGLADFGVNITVPAGETKTAQFVATKKGTFTFFCSVFCGVGHGGMTGKLIVQ